MTKPRITALLTCHNRKGKTLECLAALFRDDNVAKFAISAVLVDDGSTDGTAEAVSLAHPQVTIERGDGDLFWNRGMHRAHQIAACDRPDFLLWLNDDTILQPGALSCLYTISCGEDRYGAVVVGATVDPSTLQLTYGGLKALSHFRRFSFAKLPLAMSVQTCEAMNGNIVLVPRSVYEQVGTLDPVFEHALGDIDYALRARAAGFVLLVAPGFQGVCPGNPTKGTHLDASLPARIRWQKFTSRKGLPPQSWRHFVERHGDQLWPAYFVVPYLNFAIRILRESIKGRRG